MGRLRIGTPEEAEERRRRLTADRARRLRERRRAKTPASAGDLAAAEAPIPPATTARNAVADLATVMLGRFVEKIERLETQLAGRRAAEARGIEMAWTELATGTSGLRIEGETVVVELRSGEPWELERLARSLDRAADLLRKRVQLRPQACTDARNP